MADMMPKHKTGAPQYQNVEAAPPESSDGEPAIEQIKLIAALSSDPLSAEVVNIVKQLLASRGITGVEARVFDTEAQIVTHVATRGIVREAVFLAFDTEDNKKKAYRWTHQDIGYGPAMRGTAYAYWGVAINTFSERKMSAGGCAGEIVKHFCSKRFVIEIGNGNEPWGKKRVTAIDTMTPDANSEERLRLAAIRRAEHNPSIPPGAVKSAITHLRDSVRRRLRPNN